MGKDLAVNVKRIRTLKTSDNSYDAIIDIAVGDKELKLIIPHLTKNPLSARAYEELGNIRLELLDHEGRGFATCIISSRVFELECKELVCRGYIWIISDEHIREHCIS